MLFAGLVVVCLSAFLNWGGLVNLARHLRLLHRSVSAMGDHPPRGGGNFCLMGRADSPTLDDSDLGLGLEDHLYVGVRPGNIGGAGSISALGISAKAFYLAAVVGKDEANSGSEPSRNLRQEVKGCYRSEALCIRRNCKISSVMNKGTTQHPQARVMARSPAGFKCEVGP